MVKHVNHYKEGIILYLTLYKEGVDKALKIFKNKIKNVEYFNWEVNYQNIFQSGIKFLNQNYFQLANDLNSNRYIYLYLPKTIEVELNRIRKTINYTIQLTLNTDSFDSDNDTEKDVIEFDDIVVIDKSKEFGLFELSYIYNKIEHLYPKLEEIIKEDIFAQALTIEYVIQTIIAGIAKGNIQILERITQNIINGYPLKSYYFDKKQTLFFQDEKQQMTFELCNWIISNVDENVIRTILKAYQFSDKDIEKTVRFFQTRRYSDYFNLINLAFRNISTNTLYTDKELVDITNFLLKEFTKSVVFLPIWANIYIHFFSNVEPLLEPFMEHEKDIVGLYDWYFNVDFLVEELKTEELKDYKVFVHFKTDREFTELNEYAAKILSRIINTFDDFETFMKHYQNPITFFTLEDLYILNKLPYLLPVFSLYVISTKGYTFMMPYQLVELFLDYLMKYSDTITEFYYKTTKLKALTEKRKLDKLSFKITKEFEELVKFYLMDINQDSTNSKN